MKFLCLPGTFGSAVNFESQLQPLVFRLKEHGIAQFTFTQGQHKATPPPGFERYFGLPPNYRFIGFDGLHGNIRNLTVGEGYHEDTMRRHVHANKVDRCPWANVQDAINYVFETMEADQDIQGLLAYSEGAMIAATMVLQDAQRAVRDSRPRRIKCAIFLSGWPPLCEREGGGTSLLLADETTKDMMIDIPTLHVLGCNDPYLAGAVSLYNMCDEDTAELLDHGMGHAIPRDADTVELICNAARRLVDKV
ncbi:serine hydrolase FSH [Chaetomium sp. MPI-SDFR-AT-0129]|nr:serine hydrolase FSH [Chaetomium sp. MPI-SDFR-AT-0129]